MTRFPARLVTIVSIVACVSLSAGGVAASDRIPVQSVDDTSLSIGNRIGAVDNVVTAMDARIDRIIGSLPEGHPPAPIIQGLTLTQASLHTLIATIDSRLCSQDAAYGSGDASLADSDVFAEDRTSTGLTRNSTNFSAASRRSYEPRTAAPDTLTTEPGSRPVKYQRRLLV